MSTYALLKASLGDSATAPRTHSTASLVSPQTRAAVRAMTAAPTPIAAPVMASMTPAAIVTPTPQAVAVATPSFAAPVAGMTPTLGGLSMDAESTASTPSDLAFCSDESLSARAAKWFDGLSLTDKSRVTKFAGGRENAIANETANLKHERSEQERQAQRDARRERRGG